MTRPAAIVAATAVPWPRSVNTTSWAAPPKMMGEADQPTSDGRPDSTMARPMMSANGMTVTNSGRASPTPRRNMARLNDMGGRALPSRVDADRLEGDLHHVGEGPLPLLGSGRLARAHVVGDGGDGQGASALLRGDAVQAGGLHLDGEHAHGLHAVERLGVRVVEAA